MAKHANPKPKPAAGDAKLSFEQALHRLEEIVNQLEAGEAPLESALKLYEEGVKLSRVCTQQLQDAERRVEVLEDKDGELRAKPFGARRAAPGHAAVEEDEAEDAEDAEEDDDDEEDEDTEGEGGESSGPSRRRDGQEPLF
jgi:exodeoxyribonuclease VII small subunit